MALPLWAKISIVAAIVLIIVSILIIIAIVASKKSETTTPASAPTTSNYNPTVKPQINDMPINTSSSAPSPPPTCDPTSEFLDSASNKCVCANGFTRGTDGKCWFTDDICSIGTCDRNTVNGVSACRVFGGGQVHCLITPAQETDFNDKTLYKDINDGTTYSLAQLHGVEAWNYDGRRYFSRGINDNPTHDGTVIAVNKDKSRPLVSRAITSKYIPLS